MQCKIIRHMTSRDNGTNSQRKRQSIEAKLEVPQILELPSKSFKATIIIIANVLIVNKKGNLSRYIDAIKKNQMQILELLSTIDEETFKGAWLLELHNGESTDGILYLKCASK